jgi:glycosyltransferase involved in cell wall biosynthesis
MGLMAGARALLFPSRWAEPLARTLLEAQALGVPTVAWNSGGNRDIIRDNFNGLLADNVDEFSAHVRRLVGDDALCARLGENATQTAHERYSPDVVVSQLETIYQTVLDDPR